VTGSTFKVLSVPEPMVISLHRGVPPVVLQRLQGIKGWTFELGVIINLSGICESKLLTRDSVRECSRAGWLHRSFWDSVHDRHSCAHKKVVSQLPVSATVSRRSLGPFLGRGIETFKTFAFHTLSSTLANVSQIIKYPTTTKRNF